MRSGGQGRQGGTSCCNLVAAWCVKCLLLGVLYNNHRASPCDGPAGVASRPARPACQLTSRLLRRAAPPLVLLQGRCTAGAVCGGVGAAAACGGPAVHHGVPCTASAAAGSTGLGPAAGHGRPAHLGAPLAGEFFRLPQNCTPCVCLDSLMQQAAMHALCAFR